MHESQPFHVLVHAGLRSHFDSAGSADSPFETLRRSLDHVDFVDEEELNAPGGLSLPVLLPVNSEFQAEELRTLRVRHPLSLLIAVTNDLSGHHTYYAIRSGANFVFNVAISGESQIGMVHAQLRAHAITHAYTRTITHADGPAAVPADARPAPVRVTEQRVTRPVALPGLHAAGAPTVPDLHRADRELVRQLRTSMTVSEIARRHYCSERSMYRRIRRLYDELGVRGRAELMSVIPAPADTDDRVRSQAG
ncbi:helix-turn-helix transcriptional regulator [Streptomyces sp. NPDC059883]|uniref:helix-turn-helix transcriptional regulator n=1 Tax=unclassified Streptomyces TaxID=2593676 RepID=UPI003660DBE8